MGHGPRRIVNNPEEVTTIRGTVPQSKPWEPQQKHKQIATSQQENTTRQEREPFQEATTKKTADRKPSKSGSGSKGQELQKPALKPKGAFLKGKGKEGTPRAKKQTRFEADIGSESD